MTNKVHATPEPNRRVVVQEDEAHTHVVEQAAAAEPREQVEQVEVPWRHEPLLEALVHVGFGPDAGRAGEHWHVVAGVKAVPVGADEHCPGLANRSPEDALVDVGGHPVLDRLVPEVEHGLDGRRCFNAVFVDVVDCFVIEVVDGHFFVEVFFLTKKRKSVEFISW